MKEVLSKPLNNIEYDYFNFKNTKPVCYNNDCIYYVVFENDLETNKYSKTLHKYDFTIGEKGQEEKIGYSEGLIDMPVVNDIPLFAATTIFASHKYNKKDC